MKKVLVLLGVIVLLLAVLTACSSSATPSQTASSSQSSTSASSAAVKSTTTSSASSSAPTTTATSSTTATSTSQTNLSSILGLATGISSMKYDMVTTAPGNIVTNSTMWMKNKKMRMETSQAGNKVVMLVDSDAQTMIMYMPDQNTAMKMSYSQAPKSAADSSNSALKYSPEVVGIETLDGKVCTVIQYNAEGVATKSWIWQAKGLPVRVQVTTSMGTSTTDFKNYDFSNISDDMFVLPSGVQVTEFNIPTGIPTGMPTNFPTNFPTGKP